MKKWKIEGISEGLREKIHWIGFNSIQSFIFFLLLSRKFLHWQRKGNFIRNIKKYRKRTMRIAARKKKLKILISFVFNELNMIKCLQLLFIPFNLQRTSLIKLLNSPASACNVHHKSLKLHTCWVWVQKRIFFSTATLWKFEK
jgi:hypothetical protein